MKWIRTFVFTCYCIGTFLKYLYIVLKIKSGKWRPSLFIRWVSRFLLFVVTLTGIAGLIFDPPIWLFVTVMGCFKSRVFVNHLRGLLKLKANNSTEIVNMPATRVSKITNIRKRFTQFMSDGAGGYHLYDFIFKTK